MGTNKRKGKTRDNAQEKEKQARDEDAATQRSNPPLRGKAVRATGWIPLARLVSDPSYAMLPCHHRSCDRWQYVAAHHGEKQKSKKEGERGGAAASFAWVAK